MIIARTKPLKILGYLILITQKMQFVFTVCSNKLRTPFTLNVPFINRGGAQAKMESLMTVLAVQHTTIPQNMMTVLNSFQKHFCAYMVHFA